MTRKRILFVEQNSDGTIGGSHHSLLLLVQNLDRSTFDPIVAFYQRNPLIAEFERVARVVILPAADPVRFGMAARAGIRHPAAVAALGAQKTINVTRESLALARRMATVLTALRPDLIHMNNSVITGIEWPIAARLCGARCVAHQRGFGPPTPYVGMFDRVICISNVVREDLVSRAPQLRSRAIKIHNGIDAPAYIKRAAGDAAALRRSLGGTSDEFLIGLVGNIQSWKGQEVLLHALPRLPQGLRWRCLLIGGTPTDDNSRDYHRKLVDIIRAHGLGERVAFTGYRRDVSSIINVLDALVHTSVAPEPFGRVILEGMTLGKPVVSTDHGGPREIIDHERTGFLLPPGDSAALTACLQDLMTSPDRGKSVGRAAAQHVALHFSATEYAARVEDMYRTLWPDVGSAAMERVNRAGSDAR